MHIEWSIMVMVMPIRSIAAVCAMHANGCYSSNIPKHIISMQLLIIFENGYKLNQCDNIFIGANYLYTSKYILHAVVLDIIIIALGGI